MAESAVMLALATALSIFSFELPFGGSITPLSMLPIVLIAYRYRIGWGLGVGAAHGLIQMILGAKNLSYGTSAIAVIAIILFDYIIAFAVLGLAGGFREKFKNNQSLELAAGTALGCVLRYICHVLTGVTIWGVWAPEGQSVLYYSLTYNATYMVPETLSVVLVAFILALILDFRTPTVGPLKRA
jgi:thiamine transporter